MLIPKDISELLAYLTGCKTCAHDNQMSTIHLCDNGYCALWFIKEISLACHECVKEQLVPS